MKRKMYAYLLTSVLTGSCLFTGCGAPAPKTQASPNTTAVHQDSLPSSGQADAAQNTAQIQNTPAAQTMSEAAALEIACAHAGVTSADLLFSHVRKDFDDWNRIYEVEFYANQQEYDYEIDAADGRILNYDMDMESNFQTPASNPPAQPADPTPAQTAEQAPAQAAAQTTEQAPAQTAAQTTEQAPAQTAAQPPAQNTLTLSETAALDIACAHAGVTSGDLLFSHVKPDFDNGRSVYEVEFYANQQEYDYEIDAADGRILNYDMDMESSFLPPASNPPAQPAPQPEQPAPQPASSQIDIDTAAQTALSRVPGATSSDLRIKADRDDRRTVYEGKIIYNAREYDFEIDAATGAITEWDEESIYD